MDVETAQKIVERVSVWVISDAWSSYGQRCKTECRCGTVWGGDHSSMAKLRVPIPNQVKAYVLFASDRTCCVCEQRGRPVQIHHVDEDPSNNDLSNLAVLCLLCHNDTMVRGGFGRQLTASLVATYREAWVARVAERRRQADALTVQRQTSPSYVELPRGESLTVSQPEALTVEDMSAYIETLPETLQVAYANAREGWGGSTYEMNRASYSVIQVLQAMILALSRGFPKEHFGEAGAASFFEDFISQRFTWRRALAEPHGPGTGGTIVGLEVGLGVMRDLEGAVQDIVRSLKGRGHGPENAMYMDEWSKRWTAAKEAT